MINYERLAKGLAVVHHHGQHRVNGEEYIEHVIRVARSFSPGTLERQVAYLHDLIEDTDVRASTLLSFGFEPDVVDDVCMLTRTEGVSYRGYISHMLQYGSMRALRVKLADLGDNATDLPASLASQAGRYAEARERILGEVWRRRPGKTPDAAAVVAGR